MEKQNSRESVQEGQYDIPYHWNWTEGTEEGRTYWCYLKRIKNMLLNTGGGSHIDLGCGDGRATAFFKEGTTLEITGSDYSEKALDMARAITGEMGITWEKWSLMEAPSVKEKYDTATLIEVVEHFPISDLPQVLQNTSAVLKKGGRLFLCTPSILSVPVPAKHYQHFSEASLTKLLIDAGFTLESVEGQDDKKNRWFKQVYRFADNRLWSIKPFKKWLNKVVYQKYLDKAPLDRAGRFIIQARKA